MIKRFMGYMLVIGMMITTAGHAADSTHKNKGSTDFQFEKSFVSYDITPLAHVFDYADFDCQKFNFDTKAYGLAVDFTPRYHYGVEINTSTSNRRTKEDASAAGVRCRSQLKC